MIRYGKLDDSPLGELWIAISEDGLKAVRIGGDGPSFTELLADDGVDPVDIQLDNEAVASTAGQMQEYFEGKRREFEVEIDWKQLTSFQESALRLALEIPLGTVKTYGQLATELGHTFAAARAVGRAMATNPMPIILPCHRVVGADGELKGYGGQGGIKTKEWLLEFEKRVLSGNELNDIKISEQMRLPI